MKTHPFTVRPAEAGSTLQDFLSRRLEVSRNRAKQQIDARNVLVNEQRVWMARHCLESGDKVEVIQAAAADPSARTWRILHEDSDFLIVDKTAGVLSNGAGSVEESLQSQLQRPALTAVHRLDRDTSGCLLIAGNRTAFDAAVPLFRGREVMKAYHAIIAGRMDPPEQTITIPIEGERAITRVRTLDKAREASHVLIIIETGRTHQIRKHLAFIHHPVLGDRQYGTRESLPRRSIELGRQMLHSSSIEFEQPFTHQRVRADAPLPADFRQCLKMFRLS